MNIAEAQVLAADAELRKRRSGNRPQEIALAEALVAERRAAAAKAALEHRLRILVTDPDDALRQGQPVTVTVPDARPAARD